MASFSARLYVGIAMVRIGSLISGDAGARAGTVILETAVVPRRTRSTRRKQVGNHGVVCAFGFGYEFTQRVRKRSGNKSLQVPHFVFFVCFVVNS